MEQRVGLLIASYSIGFVRLSRNDGDLDAYCAGSGTLVAFDDIKGILTASHVLHNLAAEREIGIVRFPPEPRKFQNLKLRMENTESIMVGDAPFEGNGPDVGFLRLDHQTVSALEAYGCSFRNLARHRALSSSQRHLNAPHEDAVVGVVANRIVDLQPTLPNSRKKGFDGVLQQGVTRSLHQKAGLDLLEFESTPEIGITPTDYGGMSGGGLWRIFYDSDPTTDPKPFLLGVAFYQLQLVDGARKLMCHGPATIYQYMYESAQRRWPPSL